MDTVRNSQVGLPAPGEVIASKYRIDSVVGTGGMGIVLGATDLSLQRQVAIKFLSPERMQREGAVARFLREARAAAAIQSEHVVRVHEVGTLDWGVPYIVMEHLRGSDLAQVLAQRGPLPIPEACDLLLQVCEALAEAHARGIVHRDLKPQNLFLATRPDGTPCMKVLDFGISKAVDDGTASNLTATDTVMGTPLYMSPEQVRSLKNVDARSDIWALGSILFELVTRSPIYEAPSASALCAMIAMDPPTPLRARLPQAPPELEAIISRCLHKDPHGRYAHVGDLADALAAFATPQGRVTASRVSNVVRQFGQTTSQPGRNSGPPTAYVGAGPTTGTGPTIGTPLMVTPTPRPVAPPPHPTTQSTWQQTGGDTRAGRGAGGVIVAMLGVFTGLLLLGGGAAGYLYLTREKPKDVVATELPAEAGVLPPPVSVTVSPSPSAPPSSVVVPSTPSASTKSAAKDAGARESGAEAEAARNAALGRQAEASCRNHTMQMTTFARDDASRKRAAEQAKMFTCRGAVSSRCERQVCKEACLVLGDQMCIQQITYVIEHGPPPKY
jgi:eukaryotic-like serine/threonine-protein kinase